MAEIDDRAFDNMRRSTDRAPDRLFERGPVFTESEYNTRATTAERLGYDKEAYDILSELYAEDKAKDRFSELDFLQFLGTLDNEYLEEKFLFSKKDDPGYYAKGGKLLGDTYGRDPEQLKLSARNFYTDRRDRANVSIKAPEAESY
tara:strand:- start:11 stop:448 length:438 start_codon:yes stop_codon:yes gene_type:complete